MSGAPVGDEFDRLDRGTALAFERIAELSDFEADFVTQLADRLHRYKERTLVSERQWEVIRRIERKLGEVG